MLSGGPETATLARDTVFAAVMIRMNRILGISLAVGGIKHGIIRFNPEGAGALVATVAANGKVLKDNEHAVQPTKRTAWISVGLLILSVVTVVGLAKVGSPSIGLTIPALAVATFFIAGPLKLGLGPTQIILLMLTLVVSILSVVPGRATRLQGGIHLVIFAAFIFLSMFP
jgi:Ca2+:H+ antiporter